MRDMRSLKVWEKSHQLVLATYQATASFPKEELYGLTSQMRRASASIPMNIAEGCGRDGKADFSRFLTIAFASACETEYQLLLARDLGYLSDSVYGHLMGQVVEIKQMLSALIKKLKADG